MKANSQSLRICPARVAEKLSRIMNLENELALSELMDEPRLGSVILFLQWVSIPENYAGGLKKFVKDLIHAASDKIGTPSMVKHGKVSRYTIEQQDEILEEVPCRVSFPIYGSTVLDDCTMGYMLAGGADGLYDDEIRAAEAKHEAKTKTPIGWEQLQAACVKAAEESLLEFLVLLCHDVEVSFRWCGKWDRYYDERDRKRGSPWYFANIAEAILDFMEARKTELSAKIAETEITKEIFRWMGKARSTGRAVMISGNSRFGKTEAIKLWCAMNPGSARLVNTPASNSESELLQAVAQALGMEIGAKQRGYQFREQIGYALRHSRLMLVFDEAQFLIQQSYTRNTPPKRLNWVRRTVMDAGLPVIFVCTPQSYQAAKRKYVKATGWAAEQFDERILKTVQLPDELSHDDLLAVARIHFPGLAEQYLELVVSRSIATERSYISDIEKIATLARDNAQEEGRAKPNLADIKAAMADVLPTPQAEPRATSKPPATRLQPPCSERSTSLQEPEFEPHSRIIFADSEPAVSV